MTQQIYVKLFSVAATESCAHTVVSNPHSLCDDTFNHVPRTVKVQQRRCFSQDAPGIIDDVVHFEIHKIGDVHVVPKDGDT